MCRSRSIFSALYIPTFRARPLCATNQFATLRFRCQVYELQRRRYAATPQDVENTNVSHAKFIAEASSSSKWKEGQEKGSKGKGGMQPTGEDFDTLAEGKGKLSPTSSHLFKLILPLGSLNVLANTTHATPPPPTVFLLHPSQPLSHAGRLIAASLAPASPDIAFRSRNSTRGQMFQWSDATDVGDFIRDAARQAEFEICITVPKSGEGEAEETVIKVEVPTFADRTRFLRRRLDAITRELERMEGLKRECDREAHRGARRVALGGFAMLVVYWGAVARLTFWDYGWDIMEPITYLSGLSTVILGYLWFLFQGREVSYSSVLHQSISARRDALYKARGFDIDRWVDLTNEARAIKREIGKIAEDYEDRRNGNGGGAEGQGEGEGETEEEKGEREKERVDKVDRFEEGPVMGDGEDVGGKEGRRT
ncbi:hypothetical protein GLOTRDRAFT_123551 [Gloeophyllum trabeum ATCC 11539]|uniref:Calcium uniporter protein, mitochondrial n=1 Tax=Gloeophyllum trabeum (strain ATCC 11539 / FP-39264 / Madison 617) TaxID=670483 RepID=S7PRW3_GLOTA|nr:uncharacterized protein GLOTRDRAFT_123551 [Gloeophyllum trabeum ATCC 11539]EPQ50546.1 hypothetical protein GLOTRDRAFT_123551 [Gloeophyllum trabeum ATCC 11539]